MRYLTIIFLFIATFATGQQQMFLRSTPAGGGPANLLLDDYPGAAAAYSVRKIRAAQDSCMIIRRASDNSELLIGFVNNDVDTASINTHCSGTNCFVKTWVDATGNGNNVTQTIAASQPKIYDSTAGVLRENGLPAITFDGGNDILEGASDIVSTSQNTYSYFSVRNVSSGNGYVFTSNAASQFFLIDRPGVTAYYQTANRGTATNTGYYLYSYFFDTVGTDIYENGSIHSTGSAYAAAAFPATIGIFGWAFGKTAGNCQEIIFYPSDQSANRSAIETIINNYFSIY